MKNLKKVLSLVLVLAMVLSLGMTGLAFNDNDDIADEHKDAVNLVSLLGIINGYPDGTFLPLKTLSRAEGIKVIAVALWGGDDDGNLYSGNNAGGFTDVNSHWALGYINFGYMQGIISGVSAEKFSPNAPLSGAAFLKMCLTALGADKGRYEGAAWITAVIADATTHGLIDGVKDIVPTADITREHAAQILYNMINAEMLNKDCSVKQFPYTVPGHQELIYAADKTTVVGGYWVPAFQGTRPSTFGSELFNYEVHKNAILVQNKYADVGMTNSGIYASSPNNITTFPAVIYYNTGAMNEKYTAYVWDYMGIQKTDTLPVDLGYAYNITILDGKVVGWEKSSINAEIAYNSNDTSKTLGTVGDMRFVNYARTVTVEKNINDIFNVNLADAARIKDEMSARAFLSAFITLYTKSLPTDFDTATEIYDALVLVGGGKDVDLGTALGNLNATELTKVVNSSTGDITKEAIALMETYAANATATSKRGVKGNDYVFVDNNGDGKADYLFVTDYTYDKVTGLDGKIDDANDAYKFTNTATTKKSLTDTELAKNDLVVLHKVGAYLFIDEILSPFEGKVTRYNASNGATINGTVYPIAGFNFAAKATAYAAGNEGKFYLFNGHLVFANTTGEQVDPMYCVVYGAEATRVSGLSTTNANISVAVTLEDGTSKILTLAGINDDDVDDLWTAGANATGVVKNVMGNQSIVPAGDANSASYKATINFGGTEGAFVATASTDTFAIYEYTLSADGKSITLSTIAWGDEEASSNDYTVANYAVNGNKLGANVVNSATIAFIQKADGSFAVYKGIGKIPALTISTFAYREGTSAAANKVAAIFADALGGTNNALSYVFIPYAGGLLGTGDAPGFYIVVGDVDSVPGGYELDIFDGSKVTTYFTKKTNFTKGLMFSNIVISGNEITNWSTPITPVTGKYFGYVSAYEDGSLMINTTVLAYNNDTKYYYVDGANTKVLTATEADELLPQDNHNDSGKFIAYVFDDGNDGDAELVVIFKSATTIPTP